MASSRGLQLQKIRKNSIFVNGLNWITGAPELRQYFDTFGKVLNTFVFMDNYRGVSKGQAIVQFEDKEGLESVLKRFQHHIDGNEVQISVNKGPNSMDRQQNNTDPTDT